MNEFSAGSCIRFGWETFKKRPWFFIGVQLLIALISIIFNFVPIVSIIASIFIGMGNIAFMLKAHDDVEHVALADYWHPDRFWYYLGTGILLFSAVVGGVILLIIPGIIFGIMFSFATYLVIDRGFSPMQAMRESKRITDGQKWELFLLGIFSGLMILLGLICLIVGVFVAIPIISLAGVHAYRVLQQQAGDAPAPTTA